MGFFDYLLGPWKTKRVPVEIRMIVPTLNTDSKPATLDWEQCSLYTRAGRISDSFAHGEKLNVTAADGSNHSVFIAEVTKHIGLRTGMDIEIGKYTLYCLLDMGDEVDDDHYYKKLQHFLQIGGFGRSPRIPSSFRDHCSSEFLNYHSFSRTIHE